jgi:hypothetical protein
MHAGPCAEMSHQCFVFVSQFDSFQNHTRAVIPIDFKHAVPVFAFSFQDLLLSFFEPIPKRRECTLLPKRNFLRQQEQHELHSQQEHASGH